MATTATTTSFPAVADLLSRLGDVPPERVHLTPPPGTATDEDLIRENENVLRSTVCELVDGTLVDKAMGFREGVIAAILPRRIGSWLDEHGGGVVNGPDGMMRLSPGTTRVPDAFFVSSLHPDLAVEVLGAGNRPGEMERKREGGFAAGLGGRRAEANHLGLHVSGRVHHQVGTRGRRRGDVLPGFQVRLADVIEQAESRARKPN